MFKIIPHLEMTYHQLLLYGIHVGHSFSNSILFSAWLVYTYIQNILIINLVKTLKSWKSGFRAISYACWTQGPVWFINLDASFSGVIKYASNICGEFNWTSRWVHGFVSNYKYLLNVFNNLRGYSANAHKGKQWWVDRNSYEWLLSRDTYPRALFVSSVYNSYWPIREALTLGVPCFGVADTNALCNFITIPLPGNDESMDCMVFYMIRLRILF